MINHDDDRVYARIIFVKQESPSRRQSEGGMPVLGLPTPYGTEAWGRWKWAVSAAISAEGRSGQSVFGVLTRDALGAIFGNESVGECDGE